MRYWPNPVHKRQTTAAGPPSWRPDKEPCPDDLTVSEREALLEAAVPKDDRDPHSRRYNLRRSPHGLEFFEAKWHEDIDGEPVFHGHPTTRVPGRVLRVFRTRGEISAPEYARLVRELG